MFDADRQKDAGSPDNRRHDPAHAAAAPTATEALLRLQATAGNAAVVGLLQGPPRIQRMNRVGGYYNPADDLDGDDSDSDDDPQARDSDSDSDSGAGSDGSDSDSDADFSAAGFARRARNWTFDDVTTAEFRRDHVVKGPGDLVGQAKATAQRRKKPVSTSVLFTADDQRKLVKRIRKNALGLARSAAPDSLQGQTTGWKLLFAQFRQKPGKRGQDPKQELEEVAFGKLEYAAEGVEVGGGKQYQVNHLDGMAQIERS
jgi:hypothetical protein